MKYYRVTFIGGIGELRDNVIKHDCAENGVSGVYLPNTITKMSENSFYDCVDLQKIGVGDKEYTRQDGSNIIKIKLGAIPKVEKIKEKGCTTLPFTLQRPLCPENDE